MSCHSPRVRGQGSDLEGISPFPIRRGITPNSCAGRNPKPAAVRRRAEKNDQRHAHAISTGYKRVHQGVADSDALKIPAVTTGSTARTGTGNVRPARRNVPDHTIVVMLVNEQSGMTSPASHSASNRPTSGATEPASCGARNRGRRSLRTRPIALKLWSRCVDHHGCILAW